MSKYSHCHLSIIGDKVLVHLIFILLSHFLIGCPWNSGDFFFSWLLHFRFPANDLFSGVGQLYSGEWSNIQASISWCYKLIKSVISCSMLGSAVYSPFSQCRTCLLLRATEAPPLIIHLLLYQSQTLQKLPTPVDVLNPMSCLKLVLQETFWDASGRLFNLEQWFSNTSMH